LRVADSSLRAVSRTFAMRTGMLVVSGVRGRDAHPSPSLVTPTTVLAARSPVTPTSPVVGV